MAIYIEWTPSVFVMLATLISSITLSTAACTATECIAAATDDCASHDLEFTDTQLLQNLTTTIARVERQLDICMSHDHQHTRCNYCSSSCSSAEEETTNQPAALPNDCTEIFVKGNASSGIYQINPHFQGLYHSNTSRPTPVNVYCDMDSDGGGWTVFQRRYSGVVDFYRDWEDYRQGFGYVDGEYWLGLQNLHLLTSTSAQYELRVDLQDFNGDRAYAKYNSFHIGEERLFFRLFLGEYEGTAGDALTIHSYKNFSTKDQDHDSSDIHCSQEVSGAWWYSHCHDSNLNGLYMGPNQIDTRGMTWVKWDNTWKVLKRSEMKIRRIG